MKHLVLLLILFPFWCKAQLSERSVFRDKPLGIVKSDRTVNYPKDSLQVDIIGDTLILKCYRAKKLFYRQPYYIVCGAQYADDRVFQCELYHSSCQLYLYGTKPDSVKRVMGEHTQVFSGRIASGRMDNDYQQFDSLDPEIHLGHIGRRVERTLLSDPQAGYVRAETDLLLTFFVWVDTEGKVYEIQFNHYGSTTMQEEHLLQAEAYFRQLVYEKRETPGIDYIGARTFYIRPE